MMIDTVFTIHFFDPKMVPGTTALTVHRKAMPVNFVNRLFPEAFFGFLYTISPILSRLAVNYTKNVWFPVDF
jgi:hypothetical protein